MGQVSTIKKLMDNLGSALYDMTPDEAIDQKVCIKCKESPRFKTEAGRREYQLSGICEYCFDEEFADEE